MTRPTSDLNWVGDVLWGRSNWASGSAPAGGRREVERFGVLPSARRPRLLVPLRSRQATRKALLSYTSSKSTVRAGTQMLALAAAAGLAPRLLSAQVVVTEGPETRERAVTSTLQDHLAQALDRSDLQFAVMFQTGRPQKKPVLQLIADDGSVIGFAKIGWNELTRSLVRSEAAVLADLAELPHPQSFTAPRVLAAGPWRDLELLVVEAYTRSGLRRRRLLRELPIAATAELAGIEPTSTRVLTETPWWERTAAEVEAIAPRLGDGLRARLQTLARSVAAMGDVPVRMGWSHGDWVPWNMDIIRGRLAVWDWERAARWAPIGLDATQFLFQTELNLRRHSPGAAVDRVLASAAVLELLDVPATAMPLLLALNLVQTVIRLEQGRDEGVGGVISADQYDKAITVLMARTGGRL